MAEPPDPVLTATEHPPPTESLERLIVRGGAAALIVALTVAVSPRRQRTAGRRRGYFPRRTAIVYTSVSRTEAASRFTSERLTAAIFSGAANVSSYPVPYSSL